MIVPVGERYEQTLYLFRKIDGKLEKVALLPTLFVPMTGKAEDSRVAKPDPAKPQINTENSCGVRLPRIRRPIATRAAIRNRNDASGPLERSTSVKVARWTSKIPKQMNTNATASKTVARRRTCHVMADSCSPIAEIPRPANAASAKSTTSVSRPFFMALRIGR